MPVVGGADSKEGVVGDISVCGFDIDFVLCVRLYRFERRGGGRYECFFLDLILILFCVCACRDSKEEVVGDISVNP